MAAGAFADWAALQTYALTALSESDRTVIRCYEKAIPVPPEWVAYREALREIVRAPDGDPSQPLPERPPYPAAS
jgi:hypothetical protein